MVCWLKKLAAGTKGGPISLDCWPLPLPQPGMGPAMPVYILNPAGTRTMVMSVGKAGRANLSLTWARVRPRTSAERMIQVPMALDGLTGSVGL